MQSFALFVLFPNAAPSSESTITTASPSLSSDTSRTRVNLVLSCACTAMPNPITENNSSVLKKIFIIIVFYGIPFGISVATSI